MRVTYLVNKQVPPSGPQPSGTEPKVPDAAGIRREAAATPRTAEPGPGRETARADRQARSDSPVAGVPAKAPPMGLSSPDPHHPSFSAISWVVLQEVKHDAAMALLRLELLRRQNPARAIARATEFLRCAVGELDALAAGTSDEDSDDDRASATTPRPVRD
jgi:hypothetical protein